jgi:hypothetical protein
MRKQILLFMLGILLLGGLASAYTTSYEAMLPYYVITPCLDQRMQLGENITLRLYPISGYVPINSAISGGYAIPGYFHNVTIEAIFEYGTSGAESSGVILLPKPQLCSQASPCIGQASYRYIPDYSSWGTYDEAYFGANKKFNLGFPGTTRVISFGYYPVNSTTSQYYNGFAKVTHLLDTAGDFQVKVVVRDYDNSTVVPVIKYFNYSVVASGGAVPTQCNSTASSGGSQPVTNPITTLFGEWQGIVWFIIMLLLAGFLLYISRGNIKAGIGITLFAELIMLLIGAWLQIISTIWLLLLGVGVCLAIAVFIRKSLA